MNLRTTPTVCGMFDRMVTIAYISEPTVGIAKFRMCVIWAGPRGSQTREKRKRRTLNLMTPGA